MPITNEVSRRLGEAFNPRQAAGAVFEASSGSFEHHVRRAHWLLAAVVSVLAVISIAAYLFAPRI